MTAAAVSIGRCPCPWWWLILRSVSLGFETCFSLPSFMFFLPDVGIEAPNSFVALETNVATVPYHVTTHLSSDEQCRTWMRLIRTSFVGNASYRSNSNASPTNVITWHRQRSCLAGIEDHWCLIRFPSQRFQEGIIICHSNYPDDGKKCMFAILTMIVSLCW